MSVEFNSPYTVFIDEAERRVTVLDQRLLPHRVEHVDLKNAQEAAEAIRDMTVRGAPLIGVTGAAGMALAADESTETGFLIEAANLLKSARPTAVNLNWAVDFMLTRLKGTEPDRRRKVFVFVFIRSCLFQQITGKINAVILIFFVKKNIRHRF